MKIISTGIPLPIDNIDTDQIIPASFLKLTTNKGYGKFLFHNWKYKADGVLDEKFPLNKSEYENGAILIAGNNFGCGSSREHAAWALADWGIKAVVSTQIADIHKENEYKNGILPIELNQGEVDQLMKLAKDNPLSQIEIDVEAQSIVAEEIDFEGKFEINSFKKECLLAGVDETEYLVRMRDEIEAFEKRENLI